MGLFDPKTGNLEKIPLGPGAAPHGVVVGPDGAAWVTDGGQNAMARVDAATKAVKLFPLPKDFAYANLNTPTIDGKGVVWFTGQSGVYGRVDPATGKVDAWASPKGRGPYGMATTPAGDVWYASLAGDHIAKVDTTTGAVTVVEPPKPGVGPRRVWSDSKGVIWVSFWSGGAIGRYDPASRAWKTYPLPKGASGCYSIYVDDKDRVWATDWTANAIQRFDPKSEAYTDLPQRQEKRECTSDAGPPGRGLGRRVRHRPAGGSARLSASRRRSCRPRAGVAGLRNGLSALTFGQAPECHQAGHRCIRE